MIKFSFAMWRTKADKPLPARNSSYNNMKKNCWSKILIQLPKKLSNTGSEYLQKIKLWIYRALTLAVRKSCTAINTMYSKEDVLVDLRGD